MQARSVSPHEGHRCGASTDQSVGSAPLGTVPLLHKSYAYDSDDRMIDCLSAICADSLDRLLRKGVVSVRHPLVAVP